MIAFFACVLALALLGAEIATQPIRAEWQRVVEHAAFSPPDTAEDVCYDGKTRIASNGKPILQSLRPRFAYAAGVLTSGALMWQDSGGGAHGDSTKFLAPRRSAMRSTAILFGIVLLASPGVSANQTLAPSPGPRYPLVEAGSPKATIVLAESPDSLETYAAHELNRYVRAITGCELPIEREPDQAGGYAISLGATRRAAAAGFELTEQRLGRDGYAAAADPTGLLIAGRSPLGTLYGVYDLVEREFGVRWFVPGDLGEVVPRKETVAVGTFRREFKPSFTYRWVGDGDWALKQRMNVMVAVDGKPVGVNWKWHFHTFAILIPPEKYFDEHPEWFPLVNGKRQKSDQPHSHSTQLCTSNPEVVDKLTEGLLETLRAEPTIEIITLSPNDGGGFCECANCTALDEPGRGWFAKYSKRLAVLNQEIARRIKREFPKVEIKVGAYAMYALPPEIENYRPEPNLIIQLCHIYFCHNHPIRSGRCRPDDTYVPSDNFLPNDEFRTLAETWAGLTDKLFIYEYYSLGGWSRADMLWPMVHTLRHDIPWYRDLGAKGFYTQVGPWERAPLNTYLAAKLAWNADLDVDWLIDDYCRNFFGPAAEPMRAYLAGIEDAMVSSNQCISYGLRASRAPLLGPKIFDLPTRDKLRAWLDQAKTRAGSEMIEKRVAAVRAAFDACEKSVDPDRSSRGTNRDQAAFEAPPQHSTSEPRLLLTGQAAVGDSKPNWKLAGRALHHRSESQALDATESPAPFQVRVEAEEVVCELPAYETTNNGSGMFWGSGSAQMVRVGDRLFVSAFEAVPGVAPLNNARWALYQRTADGWEFCQCDEKDRTREPCPLGVSHSGRLLMSANPTLAPPVPAPQAKTARVRGGPARPEFLEFDPVHPEQEPRHWVPRWTEDPAFTEHSYRAFAADGNRGEFILFQKVGISHTAWAFLDREGAWKTGLLTWPKGEDPRYSVWHGEYTPVNYANVILRDRQVHYLGPSPVNIWNRIDPAKTETWGRDKWGWRMRKLHYAWTPDIQSKPFSEWIVLDDTMDDGGTIGLGDSWLAPDGRLHLVWQKEPIHPTLRDLHFPDIKRDGRMYYGIVKQGELIEKRELLAGGETAGPLRPTGYIGHPRFHVTPDLTLYVLCNIVGTTPQTKAQSGTYALRIAPDGSVSAPVRIPLKHSLTGTFFTATPRAGNRLTEAADLLFAGTADGKPVARYARIGFRRPDAPDGRQASVERSARRSKSLSQNRRGLAHFAESSEQNVPVPFFSRGFGTGSTCDGS